MVAFKARRIGLLGNFGNGFGDRANGWAASPSTAIFRRRCAPDAPRRRPRRWPVSILGQQIEGGGHLLRAPATMEVLVVDSSMAAATLLRLTLISSAAAETFCADCEVSLAPSAMCPEIEVGVNGGAADVVRVVRNPDNDRQK